MLHFRTVLLQIFWESVVVSTTCVVRCLGSKSHKKYWPAVRNGLSEAIQPPFLKHSADCIGMRSPPEEGYPSLAVIPNGRQRGGEQPYATCLLCGQFDRKNRAPRCKRRMEKAHLSPHRCGPTGPRQKNPALDWIVFWRVPGPSTPRDFSSIFRYLQPALLFPGSRIGKPEIGKLPFRRPGSIHSGTYFHASYLISVEQSMRWTRLPDILTPSSDFRAARG